MRTRFLVSLLLTLPAFWLASCTTAPATANAGTAASAKLTAIKGEFPELKRGMAGDVVRQKLGDPAEIKPMEAPTGKAEIWIYHLEKTVGMTQVASGMKDVPMFTVTINGGEVVMVKEPVYTMVAQKAAVTLSLLMFNNHLAAQKALVENSADYH